MSKFRGIGGRNSNQNHYEILGVTENCSQDEIKSAFLNLTKKYHPDTNSNDSGLHNKFIQINEAYSVLRLPDSRRSYDFGLKQSKSSFNRYNSYGYGPSAFKYGQNPEFYRARQRPFYDPTINPRRSRQYSEEMYYGINGVPRKPNLVIVGGCIAFIIVGSFLHYLAITKTHSLNRTALLERSAQYTLVYNNTRKKAEENGMDRQLDNLKQNYTNDD